MKSIALIGPEPTGGGCQISVEPPSTAGGFGLDRKLSMVVCSHNSMEVLLGWFERLQTAVLCDRVWEDGGYGDAAGHVHHPAPRQGVHSIREPRVDREEAHDIVGYEERDEQEDEVLYWVASLGAAAPPLRACASRARCGCTCPPSRTGSSRGPGGPDSGPVGPGAM